MKNYRMVRGDEVTVVGLTSSAIIHGFDKSGKIILIYWNGKRYERGLRSARQIMKV